MTMMSDTMQCRATVENLHVVTDFVEECADRFGLEVRKKFEMLVVVEEAFVNICSYAYPGGEGEAQISCSVDGDAFVLEIADSGRAFNVLSLPEPDTTLDVMEREIGGLGVHFIRKLVDEVSYRREKGRNVLRMTLRNDS